MSKKEKCPNKCNKGKIVFHTERSTVEMLCPICCGDGIKIERKKK
jgi:hypothetical protein